MIQDQQRAAENYFRRTRVEFKSVSWTDLYANEDELVGVMMRTSVRCKGNQFLERYKQKVREGKELTKKEMTQIKRLGRFMYEDVYL